MLFFMIYNSAGKADDNDDNASDQDNGDKSDYNDDGDGDDNVDDDDIGGHNHVNERV